VISGIQIKNFKGIKHTPRLNLSNFHVLVGPNASGKSTFLDAIEFVKSCLKDGPLSAVESRVPDFRDLTFMRRGGEIEIDLYLDLTDSITEQQPGSLLHYRISVVSDEQLGVRVGDEFLERLPQAGGKVRAVRLVRKTATGRDVYRREAGKYQDVFLFGADKFALSHTPPDLERYPTANAVKSFLMQGVRYIQLNSPAMREPAAATRPTELELDGVNLARVVGRLVREARRSQWRKADSPLDRWTDHLRYALDDLASVGWAQREPDNAEYLYLRYSSGLECPSWLLSDGTLRMLALTLPAFLPASPSIYMVEEPENGVHPKALEIIIKALTAIPFAQVFVATHSPLVVQATGADPLLCFSRDENGVHVVHGPAHSALKEWTGEPDLGSIFASRVLG
jgi:predicted ATPase